MVQPTERQRYLVVAGLLLAIVLGGALQARRRGQPVTYTNAPVVSGVAGATGRPAGVWPNAAPTVLPGAGEPGPEPAAEPAAGLPATLQPPPQQAVVHVAGAVRAPGVYTLSSAHRVADALAAAGGPLPDADTDSINLAARVADGQQILVPRRSSPPVAATPSASAAGFGVASAAAPRAGVAPAPRPSAAASPSRRSTPPIIVNLNTASAAELDTLPGVGPAIAGRILAYRAEHGGFRAPEEIMEVSGIGPKKFEKLAPYITVR